MANRRGRDSRFAWLAIAAASATLAYLLDPERGKRRRAALRDKSVHGAVRLRDTAGKTIRDVEHRVQGLEARAKAAFDAEPIPDYILTERLRSKLGRVVSHPHAVEITAKDGQITLSGSVLEAEVRDLLHLVNAERGVESVENRMKVLEGAAVPGPEARGPRPAIRPDFMQENWAPATRLLASLIGTAMLIGGARTRTAVGVAGGAAGTALLARAAANLPFRRLLGYGAGRRAIDIEKTINIVAPVQDVFAYWANPENYPSYMHHVRVVKALGEGRYHLLVEGPGGIPIEWTAVVTELVPDEKLAWETPAGSLVGISGEVRFGQNPDGTTRVDVRMSYNPPLGALGHALATLIGADPLRMLDEDLARFKSLVELGKTHVRGRVVTVKELRPTLRRIREGTEQFG